jgi:DeoR family transcriptional regulator, glycerol-3-phosphate regulon repressor
VAGGPVRRQDGAVIGAAAVDFVAQFKVDFAIIGTSALEEDGSLLDFDVREVRVARAIIDNARKVILVADRTKLARTAPVRIGHLSDVDIFITDAVTPAIADVCRAANVEVIEVGRAPESED